MTLTTAQAIVLGTVQGLTEFLPISSSAHLILVPYFFHWPDHGLAFDVALHMGTLAGVVGYFWRDLARLARSLILYKEASGAADRRLVAWLALASVPAALAGFLFEKTIETQLRFSPGLIACTLMGFGLLLWAADRWGAKRQGIPDLNLLKALFLGAAQSLALVPGVSRSGVTMTAGLGLGLTRAEAARFSFLMSIPITAGAGLKKAGEIIHTSQPDMVFIGFLAAAVSGWIAIAGLLRLVQTKNFTPFVIYRFGLGLLILIYSKQLA